MAVKKMHVNKNFVFSAREVTDNGVALSEFGELPVFKGEMLLTDLNGNEMPETKELLEKHYIEVEIEEKKLSLYEKMARGYQEMSKINLEEAEAGKHTYSDGMKDL